MLSPEFPLPFYCGCPMPHAERHSLSRTAQHSVDYACAALGHESRPSRTLEQPRYER